MTNLFCATLLGTLLLASADVGDARCATRVVAQDGSGVTESIWDAVDLSSPGDSILIQPGVYSEQRQYEISAGTFASTLLGIRISDLTLIGAHPDSVKLLDPAGLSSPKSGAYGFVASPQANGYRVSGISVAGAAEGFRLLASGSVANVQASSCHIGMTCAEANSIAIENSESHGVSVGILAFQIGVLSLQQLTVTSSSIGLGLQAVNDAQIYDVAIEKSGLAMTLQSGSTATASRLLVTPACGNGISLNDSSSLQLRRSQISAFSTSFIGAGASHLDARRSVFDTATYTGFDLSGGTTTQVNYCDIVPAASTAVTARLYTGFSPPLSLNFQMNYWGVTDSTLIAESIQDGYDDPAVEAIVDFSPMLEVSVPTTTMSISDVKHRFK